MQSGSLAAAHGDRSPPSRAAPSVFDRYAERDALDLVAEYPLAWTCARDGTAENASLLPLLAELDGDGALRGLLGHLARGNSLVEAWTRDKRALILVNGPQGYISPEWVSDRSWAPTWNYAQLRIEAEIELDEDGADHALERLVTTMEEGRPRPWTVGEMGSRYAGMARAIVAFRARPTRIEGRFKLGQDERPEILAEILARRPADDLSRWIVRFNRDRLVEAGHPC